MWAWDDRNDVYTLSVQAKLKAAQRAPHFYKVEELGKRTSKILPSAYIIKVATFMLLKMYFNDKFFKFN